MSEMYRFYDSDGSLLYLGISLGALRRVDQHRRLKAWWPSSRAWRWSTFRPASAAETWSAPRLRPSASSTCASTSRTAPPSKRRTRREPARLCAIGEEVFVGGRWLCVARRSVDHVELVDLDTGSTIAWPADQPIERQVRRP